MAEFAQYIINGLSQGGTYALIALGYTMVFGILQLINFAHGEVYMLGAFVGYYASKYIINNHVRITETEDYFHDGDLLSKAEE
jgi:branched-subunit amino acid ABC-type transport system permease component